MKINIFLAYSDTQNRDKTFGTIVKIMSQRVSVLRHNALLRLRHLSNRCFNLEIEHFYVIKVGMWYDENVGKHNVWDYSQGQS